MKAVIIALVAALGLAAIALPDLRGFTEAQEEIIGDVLYAYRHHIPDDQEIVFFESDEPGAHATVGASGTWYVRLGYTVWSRSAAEAHNYPSYNARSDEELARIMIGHELGHLVLSEEHERLYQEMLGIADPDYAKEEAATVFSFRVQRVPLRLYEESGPRRTRMHHWYNRVRWEKPSGLP